MTPGPTSLYDAAAELLDVAVAALGGLAPERRYVSVTLPSLDCCDQITVHAYQAAENATLGQSSAGAGVDPMHRLAGPTVVEVDLVITVVWQVATPSSPDDVIAASVLDAEAARVAAGGWALWNGVRSAIRQGVYAELCGGASVSELAPLVSSGALAGWTITVRRQLDGYDVTFV